MIVNGHRLDVTAVDPVGGDECVVATSHELGALVGTPVHVSYHYRVLVQRNSHVMSFDIAQPSRGVQINLDYADAGVRFVNVIEHFSSAQRPIVDISPAGWPSRSIAITHTGWAFPRSGVSFVWVLDEEFGSTMNNDVKTDVAPQSPVEHA